MDLITIYFSTFLLVFIGELGDKTQIAAGTGTLANARSVKIIWLSSSVALVCVAGLTVFGAGLIPTRFIPTITLVGGALLALYGIYLLRKAGTAIEAQEGEDRQSNGWKLFVSHFTVVLIAELGDKTQMATLAVALENQVNLPLVFFASASALVSVTTLTVWGVTKIPSAAIVRVQQIGALLMIGYGLYMLI